MVDEREGKRSGDEPPKGEELSTAEAQTLIDLDDEDTQSQFARLVGDSGVVPVMPLRSTVVFPRAVIPLQISRPTSLKVVKHVMGSDRVVAVFMQKNADDEEPSAEALHDVGTLAVVIRMQSAGEEGVHALIHGVARIRRTDVESTDPFLRAKVEHLVEPPEHDEVRSKALVETAHRQLERLRGYAPEIPVEVLSVAREIEGTGRLSDLLASLIDLEAEEAQSLLETPDGVERLERVVEYIEHRLHILSVGQEIREAAQRSIDERQTEAILREQLDAIQERLGEGDDSRRDVKDLHKKLQARELPDEARKEVDRELARLARIPSQSPEYNVSRSYLEWMAELPWNEVTEDRLDLKHAKQVLDEDHYGLDEIKDRILEHLAVLKFRGDARAPILCFVGPPGTGKTSLGQSIARAIDRKFVRQSLGGVHDESEIRGHRRTYIGSMPGKIIQAMRRASSKNPVMMLDEVDKVGQGARGDPHSALLEVLDPAQNDSFVDHYINVPFDLSKVMFICTANVLDAIPGPLRDRMEVITLAGYTPQEKLQIAKRHLVPEVLADLGLGDERIVITDDALDLVINGYTRDAGVRSLERQLRSVLRKTARGLAEVPHDAKLDGDQKLRWIDAGRVRELLGHRRFTDDDVPELDEPGSALGLAWTPAGGEVLVIEAVAAPGKRGMILTGQLGDVMKESVSAAMTWVRARAKELKADERALEESEVHLHVPAGAIPKDGPSAGVAMCTALVSLFTGRLPRSSVAMTGEVTLRGRVLPVGGVEIKVLGAHRMGIRTVILPKRNEHDLDELPDEVRDEMTFVLVEHVSEVLEHALQPAGKHPTMPPGAESEERDRRLHQGGVAHH